MLHPVTPPALFPGATLALQWKLIQVGMFYKEPICHWKSNRRHLNEQAQLSWACPKEADMRLWLINDITFQLPQKNGITSWLYALNESDLRSWGFLKDFQPLFFFLCNLSTYSLIFCSELRTGQDIRLCSMCAHCNWLVKWRTINWHYIIGWKKKREKKLF